MKTWFIPGASRGFGARIAELALAKGDNVVATARNPKGVSDMTPNVSLWSRIATFAASGVDV